MDILQSLQYWMTMIFLQFAPLGTLELNQSVVYSVVNEPQMSLKFSVVGREKKGESIRLKINAEYQGKTPAQYTHLVTLQGENNDIWQITSLLEGGTELLDKGKRLTIHRCLPCQKQNRGLLVSTDAAYLLREGKTEAVTYLGSPQLKSSEFNKTTFRRDNLTVEVFWNDNHSIGGVVLNEKVIRLKYEFRLKRPGKTYIGRLHKNVPLALKLPSEYCLEDSKLYHVSQYGFMGKFLLAQSERLDEWFGQVIIAEGEIKQDVTQFMSEIWPFPADYGREQSMMQIRSDWVGEETGFQIGHSTKAKLSQLYYFSARTVLPLACVSMTRRARETAFSFTNATDKLIDELEITAHYESQPGKPSPGFRSQKFTNIAAGQVVTAAFPQKYEEHGKEFLLQSYRIEGEGAEITVSID